MKFCDYGCGEEAKHQLKNGKWCCSKSQNSCSNIREKLSISSTGKPGRFSGRKHKKDSIILMREKAIGRKQSEETKIKKGLKSKKSWKDINSKLNSKERSKKISISKLESWKDPNSKYHSKERSEKISISRIKAQNNPLSGYHKPDYKKKIGIKTKLNWKNPTYVEKVQKGLHLHPNKPETVLFNLFKDLNLNYEYTGDFSFMIDGKNPDFTDKKLNKVIEFFGRRYHDDLLVNETPEEHVKNRINHFLKNGYKCLIIWEEELLNIDDLKNRINIFSKE